MGRDDAAAETGRRLWLAVTGLVAFIVVPLFAVYLFGRPNPDEFGFKVLDARPDASTGQYVVLVRVLSFGSTTIGCYVAPTIPAALRQVGDHFVLLNHMKGPVTLGFDGTCWTITGSFDSTHRGWLVVNEPKSRLPICFDVRSPPAA